jgi:hypothetical protein
MPVTLALAMLRTFQIPSGNQRRLGTRLDRNECAEQHDSCTQHPQRLRRRPSLRMSIDDRVDREHQRRRDRDRTRDVEAAALRLRVRRKEHTAREDRGDSDRDVDEEDPVPAEELREHAAEQHTGGPAAGEDEADRPHRLGTLGRLGEQDHDQRQRDWPTRRRPPSPGSPAQ